MENFNTKSYYIVGYRKIQNIIEKYYDKKFSILADQQEPIKVCGIVKKLEFTINGVLQVYDEKRIKLFKENRGYDNLLFQLLNDLANKKEIPIGNYFILLDGKDVEKCEI